MTSLFFQVSWIRRSDLKILTIGETKYTKDPRFAVLHDPGSSVWILKLTNPEPEDTGDYECQVSYHDDVEKKLTMPFALTVLGKTITFLCKHEVISLSGYQFKGWLLKYGIFLQPFVRFFVAFATYIDVFA